VVTDTYNDNYAFFAYSSDQIEKGMTVEEQTRLAYKLGTFGTDDKNDDKTVERKEFSKKRSGAEWQILNLKHGVLRHVSGMRSSTDAVFAEYNKVTASLEFSFAIQDGRDTRPCTIVKKVEAPAGSFYDEKCVESDWVVSWDYNTATDSATMTLIE